MSLSNSTYINSPSFTDLDIIEAALNTGSTESGTCSFKITDVQRELFKNHGICIRSVKWMQKQEIIPGEKISAVLRSRGDLFRIVKNGNRVSMFYPKCVYQTKRIHRNRVSVDSVERVGASRFILDGSWILKEKENKNEVL